MRQILMLIGHVTVFLLIKICDVHAENFQSNPPINIHQLAPNDPVQISNAQIPFQYGSFMIWPQADFDISALVLSRKDYFTDPESELAPIDLALGWGVMSDPDILNRIQFWQGSRYFYWKVRDYPIPRQELLLHATNVHIVPATKEIGYQLADIQAGDVVRLKGFLIDAIHKDSWYWQTSLRRDDEGAEACEILYVESATITYLHAQ